MKGWCFVHAGERWVIFFPLFSYAIFPYFLLTIFAAITLYGIHVDIHIFVHTMDPEINTIIIIVIIINWHTAVSNWKHAKHISRKHIKYNQRNFI